MFIVCPCCQSINKYSRDDVDTECRLCGELIPIKHRFRKFLLSELKSFVSDTLQMLVVAGIITVIFLIFLYFRV